MSLRYKARQLTDKLSSRTNFEPYNKVVLSSANLLDNIKVFQENNPNASVIPVLKGNAYGHGIKEIAKILNQIDLDFLAVDGYFEAAEISHLTRHQILVMGAIRPENVHLLDTKKCSFIVQDIATLKAFSLLKRPVNIHLELNTGMNRLGLAEAELQPYLEFLRKHPQLELEGVMSHLADADSTNNNFTIQQLELFEKLTRYIIQDDWSPSFIHLAQSAGSTKVESKYTNAVRIGIGLYGINPLASQDEEYEQLSRLKPVMELRSAIIKVQELQKGDKVSYNGIFTATKSMKIGVLPLGYYEGYPRELSNKGVATYKTKKMPVVGRVCMNHTMIDITGTDARVGSEVTLISSESSSPNSVSSICRDYGLFSYGLITGINEHIRREVI